MDADLETITGGQNFADQRSDAQAFWRDPALPFIENRRA